jgi:hypothetical protein
MPRAEILFWVLLGATSIAAAAALYGRYRVLPAFLTGPRICRLEAGGCAVLFRTRTAALLGVPNAALGLASSAILAAGRLAGADSGVLWIAATSPTSCSGRCWRRRPSGASRGCPSLEISGPHTLFSATC